MVEQVKEANEDDEEDPDDPDFEAAEKLIECAGDVLPALGMVMTSQEFAPYFAGFLPAIPCHSERRGCRSSKQRHFRPGRVGPAWP